MKIAFQLFCLGLLCMAICAQSSEESSSEESSSEESSSEESDEINFRSAGQTPQNCPKGQIWKECGSPCANDCRKRCTFNCIEGCFCRTGQMLNQKRPEAGCVSRESVCGA